MIWICVLSLFLKFVVYDHHSAAFRLPTKNWWGDSGFYIEKWKYIPTIFHIFCAHSSTTQLIFFYNFRHLVFNGTILYYLKTSREKYFITMIDSRQFAIKTRLFSSIWQRGVILFPKVNWFLGTWEGLLHDTWSKKLRGLFLCEK